MTQTEHQPAVADYSGMTAAQRKAARKARAVELVAQWVPYRAIAEELGCSRQTVYTYVKEYLSELPQLGILTRHRLHIAISEADNLDTILRVSSVARHYDDAHDEAAAQLASELPDFTSVEGRQQAAAAIYQAAMQGLITPSQATATLACVKEASDLDDLAGAFARIAALEGQSFNRFAV